MRFLISIAAVVATTVASAFTPQSTQQRHRFRTALDDGYVPDGMTPEEWEKQQERDRHPRHAKHFVSRTLESFQKDLEAGKVRHLFPTMFAKERVKKHYLRPSDVPYMQRKGGSYDNSDVNVGYVPDGMLPHEWHELQHKERQNKSTKDFGRVGPSSFKSRSLQSFQQDYEEGKVQHLMPQMFAKERMRRGLLEEKDVPYMQRGGSWDNSDVKGVGKLEWSETDKKYERGEGPFARKTKKEKKNFFGLWP